MEGIFHNIGDFHDIFVDSRGRSGGLALLYDKNFTVNLLSCKFHHIDVKITLENDEASWQFTGIYGWPESLHKWKTGQLILDLKSRFLLPWLTGETSMKYFTTVRKKEVLQNPNQSLMTFGLPSSTMAFMILGTQVMVSLSASPKRMG